MWQAWVYKVATDFSLVQFSGKRMSKQLGSFWPCRTDTLLFAIYELVVDAVKDFAKACLVRNGVSHIFQIVLVG